MARDFFKKYVNKKLIESLLKQYKIQYRCDISDNIPNLSPSYLGNSDINCAYYNALHFSYEKKNHVSLLICVALTKKSNYPNFVLLMT